MADTISAVKDAVKDTLNEDVKGTAKDTAKAAARTLKEQVKERLAVSARGRVEENTPEEINQQIRRDLEARVVYFAQHSDEIDKRLGELDREWDIERLLQANAGVFSLMGLTFGVIHRRWYLLPIAASAFLVQHAVQGWCPPVSLFRRLGIRTSWEICHERYALKALRGDFGDMRAEGEPEDRARQAIDAADMNL
jgi:hypothetical protein